jgi:hypothetical protein
MSNNNISIAAAVIAAISLTVSWLNYRRDRPYAKVIVFKTALIGGSRNTVPHMSINITNIGRRQLTITMVGYRILWRPQSSVIFPNAPNLPKKLAEGDSVVCLFEKAKALENGSWKGVVYVFACDSTGKEYHYNIAPFYLVWLFKLLGRIMNPFRRIVSHFKVKDND